jgi:excisionase family DNA binding protein
MKNQTLTIKNKGNGRREEITPMLTIGKACQVLYVHCNTLRRWTEKGLIKAYRVGPRGDRRYRREDVDALLAEQIRFGSNGTQK